MRTILNIEGYFTYCTVLNIPFTDEFMVSVLGFYQHWVKIQAKFYTAKFKYFSLKNVYNVNWKEMKPVYCCRGFDTLLLPSKQKDSPSTLSTTSSSSSSSSRWSSSLALSLVRPQSRDIIHGSSSKSEQGDTGTNLPSPLAKPRCRSPNLSRLVVAREGERGGKQVGEEDLLPLQAQVARSELNVRLPRGTWGPSICCCSRL